MELCLMIEGQEGVTWSQWVALARTCEAHGIPKLFRSDHYLNLEGVGDRGSLDAWGTLCGLAAVTSTVRLGTLVSPATFRHPSELAKLVTTADQISGGRVELGLGAGWHEREHEAYGFGFAGLGERMDVLEEQLQVVLGNWSGSAAAPFSFAGDHYTLAELDAEPKPLQEPHPPLLIGGSGGRRSCLLAARYGDEYNTAFASLEEVRQRGEQLAQACRAEGRPMLPYSLMTTVLIGADEDELAQRAARLEQRIGAAPGSTLNESPHGWIVGTVQDAAEQLRALSDAGIERVFCQHLLHDDLDAVALLGERLAPLVAAGGPPA
ncbi:MAG TPA: TIGR03560 family F420-dependent LLM class oxidoreductase [Solirubrobacteraceae bacterium]|nr:TIGR03560 family F420-dependent LLM class oxidoreductase [Solirubrobacteraceae bacterium]